jgi:hypothetical protein
VNQRPQSDHSLLICLLALFLVNSPLNQWWSTLTLPWYAMFLPWLLIIALVAINNHRLQRRENRNRHGGD